MVTANESPSYQQLSARNSSYLDNYMALPQMEKNYSLPYFPKHTPEVAFLGQSASNLPDLNVGQQDAVGGILQDSQYAFSRGLGFTDKPVDAPQKRFLIFDQSGNDTRLFFSPAFTHQDRTPASANEVTTRLDHAFLMKPTVEEKWDENHLTDEDGDEMLEDSEEIDALLYSDSDYDEVTSMRHCGDGYNKDKLSDDEIWGQVGSSDDSPKRQRLLDGKYKKSSLESGGSSKKRGVSSSYGNDVQSSCNSNKRADKATIRKALKILETIVPGLDNKDPLSVIDQAVAYLKSMKTEAEQLSYTGSKCNSESLEQ